MRATEEGVFLGGISAVTKGALEKLLVVLHGDLPKVVKLVLIARVAQIENLFQDVQELLLAAT